MPAKSKGALDITLPSEREILMTRVFDAPRRLVFDAWTKPELLKRWLGPRRQVLVVCEIDLRVGGAFRFVWRGPDGKDMGMRGVYREVVAPERLVTTEKFDDPWYDGEATVTMLLVEDAGKTTMKTILRYDSKEIRDGVIASPMESGVAESYDRLAELLVSME